MNDRPTFDPPSLQRVMVGLVEQQLRDDDPPETRQTFDRLRTPGYPEQTAVRMIAIVLLDEIEDMMREQRAFDREHFRVLLRQMEEANHLILDKVST